MEERNVPAPVLVGVDGSVGSLAAVELGAWEARRRRAVLHLVHGYQGDTTPLGYGWVPYASLTTSRRDMARQLVTDVEVATHARHPALTVRSTIVAASGGSTLVELSRDASLVVVGSRGEGGFAGLGLGSVAAQVAVHAHVPVIVVRPPLDDPQLAVTAARTGRDGGPVVVGIDGSPASIEAIRFAADEAVARQAPLVVASVWFAEPARDLLHGGFDPNRAEGEVDDLINQAIAAIGRDRPTEIVRRPVQHMNPAWSLIQESKDAALFVVGSRGRGGFASLLLGSVSRSLVTHALCPVAVVRSRT